MSTDTSISTSETTRTPSYKLNSWMGDLHSRIGHLRIGQLSLAGAHNSGMDKEAPYWNSYITCQDRSFRHMLDNGIRSFDFRIRWYFGRGEDSDAFYFFHKQDSGRTFKEAMLALNYFWLENRGELIIIDLQKIVSSSNRAVPYRSLYNAIMRDHGWKLLPRSAASLSIDQIKKQYPGRHLIIAAPTELANLDTTYFWERITGRWIGKDLSNATELKAYITEVMRNPPSNSMPWSMSATTYNWLGPGHIGNELSSWYSTHGEWQQKSSIISFDFCTRTNFVHNCIQSNLTKK
ncbi:Variant-surface-glycoprotein phospholipase C [Pseudomonas sp. GM55]|nr:Variant-surface-glycoprotein phospholipase C [Pseudomonas sp. GM55]